VVKAAAENEESGKEVMTLLLDRRGADVQITGEVVKAAAENKESGKEVMTLLLDRRGADVQITKEVVKAAAGNQGSGKEVMTLLLDRRGADVQITKEIGTLIAELSANTVRFKPQSGGVIRPQTPQDTTFSWFKGQLIGKGMFGRVYLGMNATTGELLAAKQVEVSAKATGNDREKMREMVAALDQEVGIMQYLDHVNIVQYLSCAREETSITIFLEYMSGGSVGSCLRRHGKFEEEVVSSLTRQTVSALAYLHREGILHGDLKADNILLDLDGTCKISGFGFSKEMDNIYGNDTTNSMQRPVFWMAPEVVRSQGQGHSSKMDIWSLGCVVLEMLAGHRPWSKEETVGAIYKLGSLNEVPPMPEDIYQNNSPVGVAFMFGCFTM
jgi:mitogen-activated protein kinase kinase kinase